MMFLLAYYHTTLFALCSHVNIFNQSECSTFWCKFILIVIILSTRSFYVYIETDAVNCFFQSETVSVPGVADHRLDGQRHRRSQRQLHHQPGELVDFLPKASTL